MLMIFLVYLGHYKKCAMQLYLSLLRCSLKQMFLKISLSSHKNTCAGVSFSLKFQLMSVILFKKRLWHRMSTLWCFPANFAEFLKTGFLTKHLKWLLKNLMLTVVKVNIKDTKTTSIAFVQVSLLIHLSKFCTIFCILIFKAF